MIDSNLDHTSDSSSGSGGSTLTDGLPSPGEASSRPETVLVRYGRVPELGRFRWQTTEPATRGAQVVIRSHRGLQLGVLLEQAGPCTPEPPAEEPAEQPSEDDSAVLRLATAEDLKSSVSLQLDAEDGFSEWTERIREWKLELELIDIEWTLDRSKLILYVLNERGPDCTRLAIQAAAAGLATVEVQPVNADGPVEAAGGGGCGSGGCGSGGCGSKGGH